MSEEGLINTKHEKIFIGKAKDFDINYLERAIKKLLDMASMGDELKLRKELIKIVPTYNPLNIDNILNEQEIAIDNKM